MPTAFDWYMVAAGKIGGLLGLPAILATFLYLALAKRGKIRPGGTEAWLLLSPSLAIGALMTPFLCYLAFLLGSGVLHFLFDPHFMMITMPLFAIVWFTCRRSPHKAMKIIAETVQPWLIGTTIVALSFFTISRWLPRTEWSSIFFAEKAASWCEVHIDKFLPEGVAINVVLIVCFFALNLLGPNWKKWTERTQLVISRAKSATAVLGVVTSFTFFGSAQAGVILEWTAQEKYDRLLDQTRRVLNSCSQRVSRRTPRLKRTTSNSFWT